MESGAALLARFDAAVERALEQVKTAVGALRPRCGAGTAPSTLGLLFTPPNIRSVTWGNRDDCRIVTREPGDCRRWLRFRDEVRSMITQMKAGIGEAGPALPTGTSARPWNGWRTSNPVGTKPSSSRSSIAGPQPIFACRRRTSTGDCLVGPVALQDIGFAQARSAVLPRRSAVPFATSKWKPCQACGWDTRTFRCRASAATCQAAATR